MDKMVHLRADLMGQRDSRKVASITLTSVAVVSKPVKAHQSLTTKPAPITSDPRLTVPATRGIWSRDESSSSSDREVLGWTRPPWLLAPFWGRCSETGDREDGSGDGRRASGRRASGRRDGGHR
jgi:hypothetical protein